MPAPLPPACRRLCVVRGDQRGDRLFSDPEDDRPFSERVSPERRSGLPRGWRNHADGQGRDGGWAPGRSQKSKRRRRPEAPQRLPPAGCKLVSSALISLPQTAAIRRPNPNLRRCQFTGPNFVNLTAFWWGGGVAIGVGDSRSMTPDDTSNGSTEPAADLLERVTRRMHVLS